MGKSTSILGDTLSDMEWNLGHAGLLYVTRDFTTNAFILLNYWHGFPSEKENNFILCGNEATPPELKVLF